MADVRVEPGMGGRVPVAVVILTFNEARNIAACLAAVVDWAAEVFVVDSGSDDQTVSLAAAAGATVVTHAFETHASQWSWALAHLPLTTAWVLGIDADQQVTADLRDAIRRAFAGDGPAADVCGFYVTRRQVFRGRWIRHGGYYPKFLLKLFRRDAVSVDGRELVDHHFHVTGTVATLRGDLIEQNRNEDAIAVWIDKHNRYARLQARQELAERADPGRADGRLFGHADERVRWLKARWRGLPLYVRPCLYFGYRYIVRAGFLDGREGFVFHVLQAFWYRLLVDINISELQQDTERAGHS